MIPTLRPIKIKHAPMPVAAKMNFKEQDYQVEKDNSAQLKTFRLLNYQNIVLSKQMS
jgi:hypothetical protein